MRWEASAYLAMSRLLPLIAPLLLRRRLARGKEDPSRWREKLGEASLPRPEGRLIWMHAVGLGEVLALRGLIKAMAAEDPTLQFLVTSSAKSSAIALQGQMPPNTRHQFLPVDAPQYLAPFLAHWRPALSIWAEQDLWPGAVIAADRRGIPLALVNARMNRVAFQRRAKAAGLYRDLFARFRLVAAQDAETARNLTALAAPQVRVTGSLKAAAPPLDCDMAELSRLQSAFAGRKLWLLASSHPGDEEIALEAHLALLRQDKTAHLLIAPRDPHRGLEILKISQNKGLQASLHTIGLDASLSVSVCDTFGEMGLWYRLCPITLIGGTFDATEGHNPWEPAALNAAILHGSHVENFANDFKSLHDEAAAILVEPASLPAALVGDQSGPAARALSLSLRARDSLAPLARELIALVD